MGIFDLFKSRFEKVEAELGKAKAEVKEMMTKRDAEGLGKILTEERHLGHGHAASALLQIGIDTEAIGPLLQVMKDAWGYLDDWGDRWRAAEALEKIGWLPRNDVEKAYYLIAKKEWGDLAKLGKPAVEPLIQVLRRDKSGEWYWRWNAAFTLGQIGDERAIEPLRHVLAKDRLGEVRVGAEAALRMIEKRNRSDL